MPAASPALQEAVERCEPRYLSIPHAAKYLSVSVPTVWRMIEAGRLRRIKPSPGRTVVDRVELDALMAAK